MRHLGYWDSNYVLDLEGHGESQMGLGRKRVWSGYCVEYIWRGLLFKEAGLGEREEFLGH